MTHRFTKAITLAAEAHEGQIRKGTENALGLALPYITHPVEVAALIQRYGGNEDQVIGGLLHDVLEDGGPQWVKPIRDAFGDNVLALVEFCTDGLPDAAGRKSPWRERKEAYIVHLQSVSGDGVLVSACDKLANLHAILLDLTETGEGVWLRFTGKKDGSLWYYRELIEAFAGRIPELLEKALRRDYQQVIAASSCG
jgi:(p)ppGpp synthase/HD superfamily hydrolase